MNYRYIKTEVKKIVEEDVFSLFSVYLLSFFYWICFPFNLFLIYIEVGLAYYMKKVCLGRNVHFADIFRYQDYNWKFFDAGFLRNVSIFFHGLFFIIPGIMKHYSYSLVPILYTDSRYKDLRGKDCLKKSSEMMRGHRDNCFLLDLSFLPLHLLSIFTFGILEIFVLPYHMTCKYKLLFEIKKYYEQITSKSFMMDSGATYTPVAIIRRKKSIALPISRDEKGNFIPLFCLHCGCSLEKGNLKCPSCGYVYENEDDPYLKED